MRFATACKSASGGIYADAFCGPGINRIRGTDEYLWGSGMLAARTSSNGNQFHKVFLMDRDQANINAIISRVNGDNRIIAQVGDANKDFIGLIAGAFHSRSPMFCVLDPQGIELQWSTVADLGRARRSANRCELLILLADRMGFMRLLPENGRPSDRTDYDMSAFFGNTRWRDIHSQKQQGEISAARARDLYADLYAEGLRSLGYEFVLPPRDVRDKGDQGRSLYQLMFATDSKVGNRIMSDIFEWIAPQRQQLRLL